MLTRIPEEIQEVINQDSGFRRYCESLLEKVDFTPRSWEYDGKYGNPYLTPDQARDRWVVILHEKLDEHDEIQRNVYLFDIAQLSKWGPQGGHAPISELMDDVVLPSFKLGEGGGVPPAYLSADWIEAKAITVQLLHQANVAQLSPVPYQRVVDDMRVRDTLESNSGYPDFGRRNRPDITARAISDAESGAWKTYPAIALFRTYNGKTRLVWMFPMATNLVEGSFFQPLQSAIMRSPLADGFFSPWKGFEAVRSLVTKEYARGNQIAASDFTSTDAHFQLASSEEVYDVIKYCFQSKYRDALHESIVHMHRIPLIVGPENMLVGDHGVASGSNWTNFIETIFDMILGNYVALKTKGGVRALYAIGDDMAWVSSGFHEGFQERLAEIGTSVGQVIRADKTMVEPNKVKTLQRLFQRHYNREDGQLRAVYSTVRALKSSIYPERYHAPAKWSADMFCARQFMILENCVDHPLFKEFVQFICAGNSHLVPFAKKTDAELDQIHREAKLIPGLTSTYNQEKRDESLGSFQSIRIAREL